MLISGYMYLDTRAAVGLEAPSVLHEVRIALLEGDTAVVDHPYMP